MQSKVIHGRDEKEKVLKMNYGCVTRNPIYVYLNFGFRNIVKFKAKRS